MNTKFYKIVGLLGVLLTITKPTLAINSDIRLHDHIPTEHTSRAAYSGRTASDKKLALTVTLPLRNQQQLETLIQNLHDPKDPQYGKYLSPTEFTANYGPTQADYDDVVKHFKTQGYAITKSHGNRLILNVEAPVSTIERSLQLNINDYTENNRSFYAPDNNPALPQTIASKITSVIGLDNATVLTPHYKNVTPLSQTTPAPRYNGTGPNNFLSPNDIKKAYNLNNLNITGTGQTLALFELDGYTPSDITAYSTYFGLPTMTLTNVLVDGFNGAPGSGAIEVTLDIELMMAIAPGATQIIVYEGPNSSQGAIDTYNRIATDNIAKQVSTSWGLPEPLAGSTWLNAENAIFQQMAAQGQTIFAASGDSGAYDGKQYGYPTTLMVDDPASQPFVTSVGGTKLTIDSAQNYASETVWNNGLISYQAGGGGVSGFWAIPTYQQGIPTTYSSTFRNVPDVALNADPNTGYSVYFNGGWYSVGGTSCGSPLWAAYTALINQQRLINNLPVIGFISPTLYALETTAGYTQDFHDITTGNNLFYSAGVNYDNATGLGSFNGLNLFNQLTNSNFTPPTLTAQTINFGTAPTLVLKGTGNLTATATSGLPISFTSTTPTVCRVSGSTVTDLTAGTCNIAANQTGNSTYSAAPQVTQTITISKVSQTITFGTAPSITKGKGSTGTVKATATSGLTVTFKSNTPLICSINGTTVKEIKAGTCTIAANQAGNVSYNAAPQKPQSFSIK